MKKLFFSILVMSLLSSTAMYAGGGKNAKKNKKKICPVECCSKECKKPPVCSPGSCDKK